MKYAFTTQSYKGDFEECKLLCESIDRFAPDIDHFIFVNDEDWKQFQSLGYGRHLLHKKSECIPWYFFRFPIKLKDHNFWISPFTFPMRGWIYQQICKLAVFDVIDKSYDFVINCDSEAILIKPFKLESVFKDGRFKLFRNTHTECDPHQWQYTEAIQKFFKNTMSQWGGGNGQVSIYGHHNHIRQRESAINACRNAEKQSLLELEAMAC